jgi:hypothetical protein
MNCYEGKGTYIFLSYAHKNTETVMPIFEGMFENGYRIWYDAGIEAGTEWPEYVAEHLQRSACCVAFMTKEFLDSHNCRQELNFALTKNIPVLVVYLEKVTLTAGMEMRLGLSQAMYYDRFSDKDEFIKRVRNAIEKKSQKTTMAKIYTPQIMRAPDEIFVNKILRLPTNMFLFGSAMSLYYNNEEFQTQNFRTLTPAQDCSGIISYPHEIIRQPIEDIRNYTIMKFNKLNRYLCMSTR